MIALHSAVNFPGRTASTHRGTLRLPSGTCLRSNHCFQSSLHSLKLSVNNNRPALVIYVVLYIYSA